MQCVEVPRMPGEGARSRHLGTGVDSGGAEDEEVGRSELVKDAACQPRILDFIL